MAKYAVKGVGGHGGHIFVEFVEFSTTVKYAATGASVDSRIDSTRKLIRCFRDTSYSSQNRVLLVLV